MEITRASDLKSLTHHFKFGENWESYAALVDEERLSEAVRGLSQLISAKQIRGKEFLDIGCGSGLSMLAALRLGASFVQGTDIDPQSVAAARSLLSRSASGHQWSVREQSIFDMTSGDHRQFDIVHSWGVLHHTGDMWAAMSQAASLTKDGGLFLIAIYRKTPLCGFWREEKKFYAHAPAWQQRLIRLLYKAASIIRIAAAGDNPLRFIATYKTRRGMDWHHDICDWLGGYPYESALPSEVIPRLQNAGFVMEKVLEKSSKRKGFFGTGCDEYVAHRLKN
jgi:2-polyprenyl-3-methyl-5-hydroxy-6-metoxy-1,4-benzoquinol methylase